MLMNTECSTYIITAQNAYPYFTIESLSHLKVIVSIPIYTHSDRDYISFHRKAINISPASGFNKLLHPL